MKQAVDEIQKLCLNLLYADTEEKVIQILAEAGYWENPDLWRWLGDEQYNYSSVGNQQSRAEQAIIEKLINSVDAKLIAAARIAGYLPQTDNVPQAPDVPQSIAEAKTQFFGERLEDIQQLSRSITVAATGAKPKEGNGRPCFTIVDDGEGQTPTRMPGTILSLHKGNKDKIKFAQGKFNMGGTGVLEFCGINHNLQFVISRRHPDLLPNPPETAHDSEWSFTVIRREDPTDGKSSRFSYLAPLASENHSRKGEILHFTLDTLPLFPDKNQPYARNTGWGTLIKLYEYDARRFNTGMMLTDGLMYRARLLLPEPALPIRFHECRAYRGHAGSHDTAMLGLIETLQRDFDDAKRDNVEWIDKLQFDVDGEQITARIFLFKNKKAADSYRQNEGVVFTYNGQSHAVMTKDFFRRQKVKQDYLWHSLLMFVDCSEISIRAHERLFMNSRDRLRDGDLKAKLEAELEDQLAHHEELRELGSMRRKREVAEQSEKTPDAMAKAIENLLNRNPILAAILRQGLRIKNPHRPEGASSSTAGFVGEQFPTKFHFKGYEPSHQLVRDAHINSHVRIPFETDAENDYFRRDNQPGVFQLFQVADDGERKLAVNYQCPRLYGGLAHMSLSLVEGVQEGDRLTFEAEVTDPSQIEPFCNTFTLMVQAEQSKPPGTPGVRNVAGNVPGSNKSHNNKGQDKTHNSFLDIPEPLHVYEESWDKHEPAFDKFTAIRIKRPPGAQDNSNEYDYFINMDNVHLQTYLKARPKLAGGMKLRFSVGMMLVALAILHQEQIYRKNSTSSESTFSGNGVQEKVEQTTCAMAPFLLPMIDSVSELDDVEDAYLSDSAGEEA